MSVVTSPPTSSWLSSFFARQRSETAAEQDTLLSSLRECESEDFLAAKKEIESIALAVFIKVFEYRYLARDPALMPDAAAARYLKTQDLADAHLKIVDIVRSISDDESLYDWKISSILMDHAIWAILSMVATTMIARPNPYVQSCQDDTAAYVMRALLFDMKDDVLNTGKESLLYKAVRYTKYVFGHKVLAAIASRNDQRFRPRELADKDVIRTFEKRYKTKVSQGFVAFTADAADL
jgi:hypothetical protein